MGAEDGCRGRRAGKALDTSASGRTAHSPGNDTGSGCTTLNSRKVETPRKGGGGGSEHLLFRFGVIVPSWTVTRTPHAAPNRQDFGSVAFSLCRLTGRIWKSLFCKPIVSVMLRCVLDTWQVTWKTRLTFA